MNKILSILLFFVFNCEQNQENTKLSNTDKGITINHEFYDIHINIENINRQQNLVVAMTLHKDAYYFSPNEKKAYKGKFFMDLGSDKNLSFDGTIIENPLAKIGSGPYPITTKFNKDVKVVYVNTTYKQPLNLKSKENFEVYGRIQFTIEPSCTFEEIPFTISYLNGKLQVKPATKC